MSNTKYTDLFNEVLPELPGVGTALVENAIRNAVIKFCADSWCWKHYPDAQSVVAAQSDYDLEAPVGADVAAVMRLTLDGAPLDPLQADDTLDTSACGFAQPEPSIVRLFPAPVENITDGLRFVLAVQPRRASASFPSWIFARYLDALAAGAKSRLLLMPGKPWSNAALGADYRNTFVGEAMNAKAEAVAGLSRAPTRTRSQH
jgi:hypothetical protein